MTIVLRSIAEVRAWRDGLPREQDVALVPTMGALHAGHISLMELARRQAPITIASIFVNPLQFAPGEDLEKYPRPIEKDLALLEAAGVDAVFLPTAAELYPDNASTYVNEERVSTHLCGAERPGHFRGVTTVVLKLFNIVAPDVAVFGQKDAQQCTVIQRMVRDLNVRVRIVRGPIVREADGLAMSSRNIYLSPSERAAAPAIVSSLRAVQAAFAQGQRSAAQLAALGIARLSAEPLARLQYWEVRHPTTLEPMETVGPEGALLAVAAHVGTTRLIDNLLIGGAAAAVQ